MPLQGLLNKTDLQMSALENFSRALFFSFQKPISLSLFLTTTLVVNVSVSKMTKVGYDSQWPGTRFALPFHNPCRRFVAYPVAFLSPVRPGRPTTSWKYQFAFEFVFFYRRASQIVELVSLQRRRWFSRRWKRSPVCVAY